MGCSKGEIQDDNGRQARFVVAVREREREVHQPIERHSDRLRYQTDRSLLLYRALVEVSRKHCPEQ